MPRATIFSLGTLELSECIPPSNYCLLHSACPLSRWLGISLSSRLVVLVEVARVEVEVEEEEQGSIEVGSSEVGSSEVSLSEKVALMLLARGRCRRGGLWVLAIKAGIQSCHHGGVIKECNVKSSSGSCHQGGYGCGCGLLKYRVNTLPLKR